MITSFDDFLALAVLLRPIKQPIQLQPPGFRYLKKS